MLKIVLMEPGQSPREFAVPADVATIGRSPTCDVVVDRPFVSKQHLRVFRGIVVVDLGSSNGSFLGGQKLTEAVLLTSGGAIVLGQSDLELRVVTNDPAAVSSVTTKALNVLRARCEELETEIARLTAEAALAQTPAPAETSDVADARLRGENESLRERIESLRLELEQREVDDGGSVQAKLALGRLESVQATNDRLQAEVDRLNGLLTERDVEIEVRAAQTAPVEQDELFALRSDVERLESELARERATAKQASEQSRLVATLQRELDAAKAASKPKANEAELAAQLAGSQKDAAALRAKVAELEGRIAAAPAPTREKSSDLFFKLQAENAELRRKLTAFEGAGAAAAPAPMPSEAGKRDVKALRELMEARLRITALESELANARRAAAPAAPVPPGTATRATPPVAPVAPVAPTRAATPAPMPAAPLAAGNATRRIFELFAAQDAEALPKAQNQPPEEFVLIESVRLLRHVERVVTRIAGDLIQLFQLKTMLPDTAGTYRDLVGDTLSRPDDKGARDRLVKYLETLGRWMVAAIGAHRKAAVLVVEGIVKDLGEEALLAKEPLPAFAKIPVLARNELWGRVCQYLATLSHDAIDERVDEVAREQAQRIVAGDDSKT